MNIRRPAGDRTLRPQSRSARSYINEKLQFEHRESSELRGVVLQQDPDGQSRILSYSGQTKPEGGDIPQEAVVDGEVMIYVDGIGQRIEEQQRQISALLHGGQDTGANVEQPVIGVHEGFGKSGRSDMLRVGKNTVLTKALQTGIAPVSLVEKAAYKNDPSIKPVKDLVHQALDAGLKVTLMAHSGGGSQVALALNLLSREQGGQLRPAIGDKVRVLSVAGAASANDFKKAGVQPENLLYTGSENDDVYRLFRNHADPIAMHRNLPFLRDAATSARGMEIDRDTHTPYYIFDQHQSGDQNRLESFLNGAPGGEYEIA